MAEIEVLAGGRRYVFQPGDEVVLGRGPDATVMVADALVGRSHAHLRFDAAADCWWLVDDSSRNGTWLGGERVTEVAVKGMVTVHLGGPESGAIVVLSSAAGAGHPGPPPATPAPATPPPATPAAVPGVPGAPVDQAPGQRPLIVRLEGRQYLFAIGQTVRVGREPSLELVSANPLVTRQQHGVITSDAKGAYYTDTSSRGTFLDGRPVKGTLTITDSIVLRLGDPATGEELAITPPLAATRIAANSRRRNRRKRSKVLLLGAVVVVVLGGVVALVLTRGSPASPTGSTGSGAISDSTLTHAESATVRLLQGSVANFVGWGSGTIISPNGLILTNGHVAEPRAPGEAVALGAPGSTLDSNPPYLTVELTKGPSSPAVATYRARPVAVDGYLDLAVVAIYATDTGHPVNPSTLNLPYLPIGDVSDVQLDQTVTVLGYPGVSGSDSISVTNGVISTFVPDPLGHVKDPRFELETTARVAHGNSGGAAINNAGQLIGVPSLTIQGEGTDISWRLRSVNEALPLIAAAKAGTPYVSHILVDSSPSEKVSGIGFANSQQAACSGSDQVAAGSTSAYIGIEFSGFPNGIDVALVIVPSGGAPVTNENGQLPQFVLTGGSGCETFSLPASELNEQALSGAFQIQLVAGPNLAPVGPTASVGVGGATGASGATPGSSGTT